MAWRPRYPSGNVSAAILGDPASDRIERAEALRRSLPEPRPDERGDIEPDALARAIRSGAAAVAEFYGLTHGPDGWEIRDHGLLKADVPPSFSPV